MEAAEAIRLYQETKHSLYRVLYLIEQGKLVRDTSQDHQPGWAIRQLEVLKVLAEAQKIVEVYD